MGLENLKVCARVVLRNDGENSMKEFMKTNTVTQNLMSFTGFKSILIFSLLLEGPKTYAELQQYLQSHEYLHESVSIDTLRVYINSLRKIGCHVIKTTEGRITRYSIDSHPFDLKIDEQQANSILKIYKVISSSIDILDLISLQRFFEKFSQYITNEDLKNKLENISPLHNIDENLIKNLITYSKNNTEITILYNSSNSGKKNIDLIVDKLSINNGKLYVYGVNSEYNNYSSFLVSKILKIVSVNLGKSKLVAPELVVGYELSNVNEDNFELLDCEKIIEKLDNKFLVEISSRNKFDIVQRIMYLSNNCKVLYPESFKNDIVNSLKQMKEGYFEGKR